MKDRDLYLQRAAEARDDADKAQLANVRDRSLRAEAAWMVMAERAERTERLRAAHEIAKAHEAAKAAADAADAAAEEQAAEADQDQHIAATAN
jgi:hypothetical protein